eukprot:6197534-Prymnesium_polylepis.1
MDCESQAIAERQLAGATCGNSVLGTFDFVTLPAPDGTVVRAVCGASRHYRCRRVRCTWTKNRTRHACWSAL